jgi:hypothetical protein
VLGRPISDLSEHGSMPALSVLGIGDDRKT